MRPGGLSLCSGFFGHEVLDPVEKLLRYYGWVGIGVLDQFALSPVFWKLGGGFLADLRVSDVGDVPEYVDDGAGGPQPASGSRDPQAVEVVADGHWEIFLVPHLEDQPDVFCMYGMDSDCPRIVSWDMCLEY